MSEKGTSQLESWNRVNAEKYRRVDGAEVKADSPNPERPWTASSPAGNLLIIAIFMNVNLRTWKSCERAMEAVDRQFPLRFKPAELTLHGMMRELDVLQRGQDGKSLTKC